MRFIVIGITDAPHPWFPPEVMDIIRKGKVFSGGKRHHELVAEYLPADAEWIDITIPLDAVFDRYRRHPLFGEGEGGRLIVFASGDPLFFGFANTIRREMPEADITVYPTFNSLQMLAHRLTMPYHDMRIVSLTGRPWPEFDRALIERAPKIGILTDREHTPAAIAQRMLDYGYTYYNIYVGEHLGHPEKERISSLTLEEATHRTFDQPNCVILHSCHSCHSWFGIPETSFTLLDGREKMITKMPIRLLTLQALDLPKKHVLWDIGFCTGSVSIEARLLFPHLQIEAFEIRPECEAIIQENARRFGAPGIHIHIGDFKTLPLPLPVREGSGHPLSGRQSIDSPSSQGGAGGESPDAVFIGGHSGHLKEIMAKVKQHLAPGGCIVMNSVTVRSENTSLTLWNEACRELGFRQLPSTHIVLNDNNPIDILKCELPS